MMALPKRSLIPRRNLLGTAGALAAIGSREGHASVVNRTARLLIGFPPGGASDVVARLLAERLRNLYAPQVVVENRAGAGGRVAIEAAKAASPDGTVFVQSPASPMTILPYVYDDLRYDALVDFVPVTAVCSFPFAFAVSASHPARDLAGFTAWAKQREPVPFGSAGAGSMPHFLGDQLGSAIGVQMLHAPYRGNAAALQDLIGGGLPAAMVVVGDAAEMVRSGLVRVLAVSAGKRLPRLPEAPCFAELGYPALTAEEWFGMFLPARTPPAVVEGLHAALTEVTGRQDMAAALARMDLSPLNSTPAEFAGQIRAERERWGRVIRASGFRMDDREAAPQPPAR